MAHNRLPNNHQNPGDAVKDVAVKDVIDRVVEALRNNPIDSKDVINTSQELRDTLLQAVNDIPANLTMLHQSLELYVFAPHTVVETSQPLHTQGFFKTFVQQKTSEVEKLLAQASVSNRPKSVIL